MVHHAIPAKTRAYLTAHMSLLVTCWPYPNMRPGITQYPSGNRPQRAQC